jgi:hypothetical protein
MRPTLWVLLLTVWAGGCVTLPTPWGTKKEPPPPPAKKASPPAKPVSPEQINDNNAHEKANALLSELDREAAGKPPASKDRP